MPSGAWFAQVHPVGGKPRAPMVFADFDKLYAFIEDFRKSGSQDALKVHLPERATKKEQQVLEELGAEVSPLS